MVIKQHEIDSDAQKLRSSIYTTLIFVFVIWLVKIIEWSLGVSFASFGILPRTVTGLKGILFSPFLHGDAAHIITNTVPLMLLGIGLLYFYQRIAYEVFFWMFLSTGIWTWIIARNSYHIGASGLIYALAAFLFFSRMFRKDNRLMIVSMVILFLYGGMIHGVFPNAVEERISWESHLMGALSGFFLAIYFRKEKTGDEIAVIHEDEENDDKTNSVSSTGNISWRYTYKESKPDDDN
ncbi:MAG: rhomboid family intramembrane serine protease [Cyclobacteriaceae bacterium]